MLEIFGSFLRTLSLIALDNLESLFQTKITRTGGIFHQNICKLVSKARTLIRLLFFLEKVENIKYFFFHFRCFNVLNMKPNAFSKGVFYRICFAILSLAYKMAGQAVEQVAS